MFNFGKVLERCELLSNYYLCRGKDNVNLVEPPPKCVVNCFQITIFAGAKTTYRLRQQSSTRLWIAFKLLSLQGQRQLIVYGPYILQGCELLSNYYLCRGKDNQMFSWFCQQRLWIAFKLLSLQGQRQPLISLMVSRASCELLSNYYLCRGKDNFSGVNRPPLEVVNCFQITIFAGAKTTFYCSKCFR